MNQTDIVKKELLEHQDLKFQAFSAKLMPEIDSKTVLGVRMPVLREMARTMDEETKTAFLNEVPHQWHEENLLHILLINAMKDSPAAWQAYLQLQPCIRTWALTDTLTLKALGDNQLLQESLKMLESSSSWIRRQAVIWIIKRGLKKDQTLDLVRQALAVPSAEREVRLALGWMLCEGLCQNRDVFLPFLLEEDIDLQVFRTALSKCRDSRRVSRQDVQLLKERLFLLQKR